MRHLYELIHLDDRFHALQNKRSIVSWTLAGCIFITYFSFITVIAFAPHLFAARISPDSVITWGMPIGILVILVSFVLTGVYVHLANRHFDQAGDALINDAIEAHNAKQEQS